VLKTLAMIVRRSDFDRDAFRRHYEEVHSPLALPLLEGLVRYVKYHVVDELHGRAGFDVISAFWYASGEAAAATVRRVESADGEAIRRDELSFMDKQANRFVVVEERCLAEGAEGGEGTEHVFVLVKAQAAEAVAALDDLDARLLGGPFGEPAFALQHVALGESGAFDRVTQLRLEKPLDRAALGDWAAAEEAGGSRVLVLRTRLYETPTPWEAPSSAPRGRSDTAPRCSRTGWRGAAPR